MPPVLIVFGAVLMPLVLASMTYVLAGGGRELRPNGLIILLGIVAAIGAVMIEEVIRIPIAQIANPTVRIVSQGFIWGALPEELLKFFAFLLWLVIGPDRRPRNALFGAVAIAMTHAAAANANAFQHAGPELGQWLETLAIRSFIATPTDAADAFIVGIWTAIAVSEGGWKSALYTLGALGVAVLAHGLWNTGFLVLLTRTDIAPHFASALGECLLMATMSVAVQSVAIAIGIRNLNRCGVYLRWPRLAGRR
jgi:hypothetical protein